MKLIEALEILKQPIPTDAPDLKIYMACGFVPLHLRTFLAAHLQIRFPQQRVSIDTGIFGDLTGNIERMKPSGVHRLVVVVEWADLDPRLGMRRLGGWHPSKLSDIAECAERVTTRMQQFLLKVSRLVPTVVCMPTLPLPPLSWTQPDRASSFEFNLHQTVTSFAAALLEEPNIEIVNAQLLGETSPPSQRFDLKCDVIAGFPYSLPHANALGELFSRIIDTPPRKKGLITDLDDTLWSGILGEDGLSGISWHMESQTHIHGLYQQFVASLAGAGVLIGVASKNDRALVEQAFNRSDLLISRSDVFPLEVHWSRKPESVKRILDTWNVAADSVVFIDDSPMEVAEVKAAFPELECIVFPKGDYPGILDLMKHLRSVFGKSILTEDDALRLSSIRTAKTWQDKIHSPACSSEDFLRTAESSIVFSLTREIKDPRAFELVNKTNQFNLNGKRFSESEWQRFCNDPTSLLITASYKDKYGPLGKITVIMGRICGRKLYVHAWVMSCRAFSRRIEHQCLKYLFDSLEIDEIWFDYAGTSRNAPLHEFFAQLLGIPPVADINLSRKQLESSIPALFHHVEGTINV